MEYTIKLSTAENKDLTSYCKLNNLEVTDILKKSFTKGFNIEKYGLLSSNEVVEKEVIKEVVRTEYIEVPVEKEVIKEIVKTEYVEVPVEKEIIREVIKTEYVEVPIEIIKEIPIIETIESKESIDRIKILQDKIETLESQLSKPIEPKYIEVPIEKEIIVEKIVTDNTQLEKINTLQKTIQKIREDLIDKENQLEECNKLMIKYKSLQDPQKVAFLRGSDLNKLL